LDVFTGTSLAKLKRVAGTMGTFVGAGAPTLAWLKVRGGQTYFVRVSRHAPVIPAISGYSAFTLAQPDTTLIIQRRDGIRAVEFSLFGESRLIRGKPTPSIKARVRMPDGSYVNGATYRAQLYVGPNASKLHPVGSAQKFMPIAPGLNEVFAGTIVPTTVVLSGADILRARVARIRVWDASRGETYEAAIGRGLTGESPSLRLRSGELGSHLEQLSGLRDFSLKLVTARTGAANPSDSPAGVATLSYRGQPSQPVWRLTSPPGSRYAIEAQTPGQAWETILTLTNATGQVEFIDPRTDLPPASFYRARRLP
jgi:hypothetical protein